MIWVLMALSCKNDAQHHQSALANGAQADCSPIEDLEIQGDCMAWKARKQSEDGDLEAAATTCAGVAMPLWQSECWFMVSDASNARGQAAVSLCSRAAEFEEECLGHALNRSLEEELRVPGREAQAHEELEQAWLSLYQDPRRSQAKADAMFVSALLRRPRPYTRGSLGNTPDRLTLQVLSTHITARNCSLHGIDVSSFGQLVVQAWESAECGAYPGGEALRP